MDSQTKLTDLKGSLITRAANIEAEATRSRDNVVLIEAQLVEARRSAALSLGALQATRQALADIERAFPDNKPSA